MSSQVAHASLRRMLLTLDAINCESALIDAAIAIATKLDAELDALFVEDSDIYAVAELPITQEISLHSARERDITGRHVERAVRARLRAAEQRFSAALARSRLKGRFDVRRAQRGDALIEAASRVDVLLLLPCERAFVQIQMRSQPRASRVFAICGDSAASRRVAELAARLAQNDHGELELICRGEPRPALLAESAMAGVRVNVRALATNASLGDLLREVDNRPGNTLLIAADLSAATEPRLAIEALASMRCRVLLVN